MIFFLMCPSGVHGVFRVDTHDIMCWHLVIVSLLLRGEFRTCWVHLPYSWWFYRAKKPMQRHWVVWPWSPACWRQGWLRNPGLLSTAWCPACQSAWILHTPVFVGYILLTNDGCLWPLTRALVTYVYDADNTPWSKCASCTVRQPPGRSSVLAGAPHCMVTSTFMHWALHQLPEECIGHFHNFYTRCWVWDLEVSCGVGWRLTNALRKCSSN